MRHPSVFALPFALLLVVSSAHAQETSPQHPATGLITVSRLEGTATGSAPGSDKEEPLRVGAVLSEGSKVKLGAASRMELSFASGTIVRLGPGTSLELRDAPIAGGRFHARLLAGDLWAHVHKLLGGETFEVETENAVAGVRGTIFRVTHTEASGERVRVYEGRVQVDGKNGLFSRAVMPGEELKFDKDGAREIGHFQIKDDKEDKAEQRERDRDHLRRRE